MPRSKTFFGSTLLVFATLSALGCGDRNIKQLTVGISRDSVIKILGQGSTGTDSTPNVYREDRYLNAGHMLSVLMYSNSGKKAGTDSIPEADLLPVVLRDDTLTGWGWAHYDSVALANNIQPRPRGTK